MNGDMKNLIQASNRSPFLKESLIAVAVFASRFAGLPANFSPLGSFGFFGSNVGLVFSTIVIFDWYNGGLYPGFWLTYLGFFAYVFLGRVARNSKLKQLAFLPLASFVFFLLSNFGVWLYWYPNTLEALVACYVNALPFYKNTLLSDLFFGYGFMLVSHILSRRENKQFSLAVSR